jgi:hypothetical protein
MSDLMPERDEAISAEANACVAVCRVIGYEDVIHTRRLSEVDATRRRLVGVPEPDIGLRTQWIASNLDELEGRYLLEDTENLPDRFALNLRKRAKSLQIRELLFRRRGDVI